MNNTKSIAANRETKVKEYETIKVAHLLLSIITSFQIYVWLTALSKPTIMSQPCQLKHLGGVAKLFNEKAQVQEDLYVNMFSSFWLHVFAGRI